MEYAKDVVYNLKCDKMINKKWTSKIKEKVKEKKMVIAISIFLISFMLLDIYLLMSFAKLLKML